MKGAFPLRRSAAWLSLMLTVAAACDERRPSLLRAHQPLALGRLADGGNADASKDPSSPARRPSPTHATREWRFPNGGRAVVILPEGAARDESGRDGDVTTTELPVVIALHGRGEAVKGPEQGAWGWPRDYKLTIAMDRLGKPPLVRDDFRGFVTATRLEALNRALDGEAYGGVIVVAPYLPDLDPRTPSMLDGYGEFVTGELLPRIERETNADMRRVGIDGVSLGGAVALYVGFAHAASFARVGAIQPAILQADAAIWFDRAKRARAARPTLEIQLVTSEGDYFRDGIIALSAALTKGEIAHRYHDLPGPHDYVFNQGPGSYELLFFHAFRAR